MKNLIIVGAGGMGRSFFDIAVGCIGYMTEFHIKGFLDDDVHQLDAFEGYPSILGTIVDYILEQDDVFTCSIGNVVIKKVCCSKILHKGGKFITLVSKNAIVGKNAKVAEGAVIAPYAILGTDCLIGENVLVQSFAVIGHDVSVGNWSRIDTHVTCVGGVVIEEEVTLHTNAVINHNVVIESRACVGAGSFVIKRVKSGTTVYGNPAIKL